MIWFDDDDDDNDDEGNGGKEMRLDGWILNKEPFWTKELPNNEDWAEHLDSMDALWTVGPMGKHTDERTYLLLEIVLKTKIQLHKIA